MSSFNVFPRTVSGSSGSGSGNISPRIESSFLNNTIGSARESMLNSLIKSTNISGELISPDRPNFDKQTVAPGLRSSVLNNQLRRALKNTEDPVQGLINPENYTDNSNTEDNNWSVLKKDRIPVASKLVIKKKQLVFDEMDEPHHRGIDKHSSRIIKRMTTVGVEADIVTEREQEYKEQKEKLEAENMEKNAKIVRIMKLITKIKEELQKQKEINNTQKKRIAALEQESNATAQRISSVVDAIEQDVPSENDAQELEDVITKISSSVLKEIVSHNADEINSESVSAIIEQHVQKVSTALMDKIVPEHKEYFTRDKICDIIRNNVEELGMDDLVGITRIIIDELETQYNYKAIVLNGASKKTLVQNVIHDISEGNIGLNKEQYDRIIDNAKLVSESNPESSGNENELVSHMAGTYEDLHQEETCEQIDISLQTSFGLIFENEEEVKEALINHTDTILSVIAQDPELEEQIVSGLNKMREKSTYSDFILSTEEEEDISSDANEVEEDMDEDDMKSGRRKQLTTASRHSRHPVNNSTTADLARRPNRLGKGRRVPSPYSEDEVFSNNDNLIILDRSDVKKMLSDNSFSLCDEVTSRGHSRLGHGRSISTNALLTLDSCPEINEQLSENYAFVLSPDILSSNSAEMSREQLIKENNKLRAQLNEIRKELGIFESKKTHKSGSGLISEKEGSESQSESNQVEDEVDSSIGEGVNADVAKKDEIIHIITSVVNNLPPSSVESIERLQEVVTLLKQNEAGENYIADKEFVAEDINSNVTVSSDQANTDAMRDGQEKDMLDLNDFRLWYNKQFAKLQQAVTKIVERGTRVSKPNIERITARFADIIRCLENNEAITKEKLVDTRFFNTVEMFELVYPNDYSNPVNLMIKMYLNRIMEDLRKARLLPQAILLDNNPDEQERDNYTAFISNAQKLYGSVWPSEIPSVVMDLFHFEDSFDNLGDMSKEIPTVNVLKTQLNVLKLLLDCIQGVSNYKDVVNLVNPPLSNYDEESSSNYVTVTEEEKAVKNHKYLIQQLLSAMDDNCLDTDKIKEIVDTESFENIKAISKVTEKMKFRKYGAELDNSSYDQMSGMDDEDEECPEMRAKDYVLRVINDSAGNILDNLLNISSEEKRWRLIDKATDTNTDKITDMKKRLYMDNYDMLDANVALEEEEEENTGVYQQRTVETVDIGTSTMNYNNMNKDTLNEKAVEHLDYDQTYYRSAEDYLLNTVNTQFPTPEELSQQTEQKVEKTEASTQCFGAWALVPILEDDLETQLTEAKSVPTENADPIGKNTSIDLFKVYRDNLLIGVMKWLQTLEDKEALSNNCVKDICSYGNQNEMESEPVQSGIVEDPSNYVKDLLDTIDNNEELDRIKDEYGDDKLVIPAFMHHFFSEIENTALRAALSVVVVPKVTDAGMETDKIVINVGRANDGSFVYHFIPDAVKREAERDVPISQNLILYPWRREYPDNPVLNSEVLKELAKRNEAYVFSMSSGFNMAADFSLPDTTKCSVLIEDGASVIEVPTDTQDSLVLPSLPQSVSTAIAGCEAAFAVLGPVLSLALIRRETRRVASEGAIKRLLSERENAYGALVEALSKGSGKRTNTSTQAGNTSMSATYTLSACKDEDLFDVSPKYIHKIEELRVRCARRVLQLDEEIARRIMAYDEEFAQPGTLVMTQEGELELEDEFDEDKDPMLLMQVADQAVMSVDGLLRMYAHLMCRRVRLDKTTAETQDDAAQPFDGYEYQFVFEPLREEPDLAADLTQSFNAVREVCSAVATLLRSGPMYRQFSLGNGSPEDPYPPFLLVFMPKARSFRLWANGMGYAE